MRKLTSRDLRTGGLSQAVTIRWMPQLWQVVCERADVAGMSRNAYVNRLLAVALGCADDQVEQSVRSLLDPDTERRMLGTDDES